MSSIIKGRRIRNETTLEIKQEAIHIAPEETDKNLDMGVDLEEQEQDLKLKAKKAKEKAANIIEEATRTAKIKADAIIKESQEKSEKEAALALEKAQEEGYLVGFEKGSKEAESLIENAKQMVLEAKNEKKQILDGIEPEVIEMVIRICGKLIDEEIEFNKDTILILINKALGKIVGDITEITIKVSPDQYEDVLENKDLITSSTMASEDIQVRQDGNLSLGACVVETPFGSVECDVSQGFAQVKKQMRLIYNKK